MKNHKERAHSKFSASGAERWFNCSGSVALSEGIPSKDSVWSLEGTKAHEILERILIEWLKQEMAIGPIFNRNKEGPFYNSVMLQHALRSANFLWNLKLKNPDADFMIETRIYLSHIHPAMFGTFDSGIVDHFGTLHIYDFKYGAGHAVCPKENLQMLFYAIGLAEKFHWNFKRVRMWIDQPRIKGFDGPVFWEITINELRFYESKFRKAVRRVEENPHKYTEGSWCHWCPAKTKCPLKREAKLEKSRAAFMMTPLK